MITVEVTQADIDSGGRGCVNCPVALALSRATGIGCKVGLKWFFVRGRLNTTPLVAQEFIASYDDGLPVKPFTFEINLSQPTMMDCRL